VVAVNRSRLGSRAGSAAGAASTMSSSSGISSGAASRESFIVASEFVRAKRVTAIPVETEPLAACIAHGGLLRNDFRHALETAEEGGNLRVQVDEQVAGRFRFRAGSDHHGRRIVAARKAVRHEAAVAKGPQQIIQPPR